MTVGELTPAQALARFGNGGLAWRVGPYAIRAKTELPDAAEGLRFLYSAFPVLDGPAIVDAEIDIRTKPLLHRRVSIAVDGEVQFDWIPRRILVPMAEWALNVCVFHRSHQYFMLHAAVVERGGRAVLLVGRAGSGKSTLCAALVHRGWRLLSDEVALIRPFDVSIQPVPRPVSLKEESIEVIRRSAPHAVIGPTWLRTSKGNVAHMLPTEASVARVEETAAARWLFFPRFDREGPTATRPLSKARALLGAADNSFNYSVLGRPAFETLVRVVDGCDCFELPFADLESALHCVESCTTAG